AIVAVVERGKADVVVDKAKQSGAAGATILFGRGTGQEEVQKMFHHLHVESSKEIILILCREFEVENILNAIVEAGKLREPGKGIAFTFPVFNLVGLEYRRS
ncbi:MAG: P-II family nitrogen regulator, partial [Bacillota bacterium]